MKFRNVYTSFKWRDVSHSTIALIFSEFIHTSSRSTIIFKNFVSILWNSHLFTSIWMFALRSRCNIFLTCCTWSFLLLLYINMSSRYAITNSFKYFMSVSFMKFWNVDDSLINSKDIIKYLYVSYFVLKMMRFSSSFKCMRIRLNACLISILIKNIYICIYAILSTTITF